MDIDFELTRQENAIVPASGDTYAFASKADGDRSSLVSMTEGDVSISWELVGTDQNERPVPLASSPAVIDQPAMAAQAVRAAPAAPAEAESLSLESLQQRTADLKSARSAVEIDSGELTGLAEDIDAYNRQFLNNVSFGESTVTYPNALGQGVDVRYTASKGRIKEDVIVGAPGLLASYTAVIQLGGLQAAIDQQGGIAYSDETGSVIFTTAPPIMYDAGGVLSEDITVDLTVRDGIAYVTYTPDPVWMEAPERTYPVVLDPLYTNTLAQNVQVDTYVHSGNTSSGQNDSTTTLYIGNKSVSGTRRPHYAYWRIKRASMPTLPSNTYITSATFSFRLVNGTSSRGAIQLYGVSSSAGEWSSSNMLWSSKPAQGSLLQTWAANSSLSSGSLTMSASVTSTVADWYARSQSTNTGFMIKYASDTYADHNALYSSDFRGTDYLNCIPQLVIYYAAMSSGQLSNGSVYYIINKQSGHFLEVPGGYGSGTDLTQFRYSGGSSQKWKAVQVSGSGSSAVYEFIPQHNTSLRMDVEGGVAANDIPTQVAPSNNTISQRFTVTKQSNGAFYIRATLAGNRYVKVKDNSYANNAAIVQHSTVSDWCQWFFVRADHNPLGFNGSRTLYVKIEKRNGLGYLRKFHRQWR